MNPQETPGGRDLVRRIRDQGLAVVVIEHDMRFILGSVRPGRGAGPGREAGRGHARGGPARPPGDRGLPREAASLDGRALLEVKDLHVAYGRSRRSRASRFDVDGARSSASSAANGAGKTTTLRTLSGLLRPGEGAIFFDGQRIDQLPAHEIVGLGVAQSPEGRRIFPRMTVRENLDLGAFIRRDPPGSATTWTGHTSCSRSCGAGPAGRRHPVRRRAADAGHGPGAHGPAPAAHARRAVDGAVARS